MPEEVHSRSEHAAAHEPSYVLHLRSDFRWENVAPCAYKDDGSPWKGVTRSLLAGGPQHPLPFHLRYFEIAPGGFSTLEKHAHEHVVYLLRGRGLVRLGQRTQDIGTGDVVYVAPWKIHQFRNPAEAEPLGFLCIVTKEHGPSVVIEEGTACCSLPAQPGLATSSDTPSTHKE